MDTKIEALTSALESGVEVEYAAIYSGYNITSVLLRIQEGAEEEDRVSRGLKARKNREEALRIFKAYMYPKRKKLNKKEGEA